MTGSNKEGKPSIDTRGSIEVFMQHDEGIFVVACICGAAKIVVLRKKRRGKLSELSMVLHGFVVIYVAWFSVLFLIVSPLSFLLGLVQSDISYL